MIYMGLKHRPAFVTSPAMSSYLNFAEFLQKTMNVRNKGSHLGLIFLGHHSLKPEESDQYREQLNTSCSKAAVEF